MKFPKKKKEIKQLREQLDIASTKSIDKGIKFYEKMAKTSKVPSFQKSMNELTEETKRIKDKFERRLVEIDSEFPSHSREQMKKRLRTLTRR